MSMKKLFYLFLTLFALVGCDNKDEFDQIVSNNPEASELPQTLYATILNEEDAQDTLQSRTYLNSNRKVVWHAGDEISFFSKDTHGHYVSKGKDGDEHVVFDLLSETPVSVTNFPKYSLAVYPYDATITCEREGDQDKLHVTYPATQTYAANTFARGAHLMVSAGTIENGADSDLRFRNACGYLVLKLYGHKTKVKTITLSSRTGNEKIAGAATIVAKSNAVPVTTMANDASSTVTLNCGDGVVLGADAAHATEFWFMLPPVTFESGIKVVVTDVNDITYTKETTKAITVARNSIKPMAPFEFVASNKIWYTKVPDSGIEPITFDNAFDADIIEHQYDPSVRKYFIRFNSLVRTIKKNAFKGTALQTIELPDGLETIEEGAFRETQLPAITIPGSVNTIKTEAFLECRQLESIEFLPSPTLNPLAIACREFSAAEYGPFQNSYFKSINLNRELAYVDPDGISFAPDEVDEGIFYNTNFAASISVTIGGQVKTISDYMFAGVQMKTLTIPGTVTTIGNDVFNECTALTSLTFEPSPTGEPITIGMNKAGEWEGIFVDCKQLRTLNLNRQIQYSHSDVYGLFMDNSLEDGFTLGEQVHTLLPHMFYKSGITSLVIPATVEVIENEAFCQCSTLSSIRFEESATPLTIGYLPARYVWNDERGPFYDTPLTSIYVNRELVASQEYAAARDQADEGIFSTPSNSRNVTVTLQGNVNTISDYMFSGVNMQTIWIPREVRSIGYRAFYNCSQLYGVTLAHTADPLPPTLSENAFEGTLIDDPDVKNRWIALEYGYEEKVLLKFKSAPYWKEYAAIIIPQIKNP